VGQGLQYVGEDDQGLDRWVLQFRTQTMLELLAQVIGTDTAAIVDDQGRAFVVSPPQHNERIIMSQFGNSISVRR